MTPPRPEASTTVAVTLGDPRGVGPEVVARAARELALEDPSVELVLFGPDGLDPFTSSPGPGPAGATFRPVGRWDGSEKGAGRVSVAAIEAAVELASTGAAGAVVTGPVHKPALRAAGVRHPGHTELLQELAGAHEVGMLMCAERTRVGGALRVLLATTHVGLAAVPRLLTSERLESQTRLVHRALRTDWGIPEPRVALCAFNPHASDDGMFGDEEARIYAPALEALRGSGLAVEGPLPADTVFVRALGGAFDAVVAPYHDVAMAAFKTVSFGTGVNVTLGLPFVRTSPDHGTAFDIAGQGVADPTSTLEALRLATHILSNRPAVEKIAAASAPARGPQGPGASRPIGSPTP